MEATGEVNIPGLDKIKSGKVREMFSFEDKLLIVTTDRISAFDFILKSLIPYKGIILNKISNFWFKMLESVMKNHLIETDFDKFPDFLKEYDGLLRDRSVIVKKANIIPLECVARGYISGSGWEEYKKTGKVGDLELPVNLKMSQKLPEPIFTPTTKADVGHDMPVTIKEAKNLFGSETVGKLQRKTIELYIRASEYALKKGIIIADTKFEFGKVGDSEIIVVDEALTPDSSRFWPLDEYEPGRSQNSFDKQYVRDYLLSTDWDRKSVPPALPDEIILKTSDRYIQAYEKLTSEGFVKY